MPTQAVLPLALLLALLPFPAQGGEARASGEVALRDGPGSSYDIIGRLEDGAYYEVEECEYRASWCLVSLRGNLLGWVRGSYLVGSGAKAAVTPFEFLSDPEFEHFDPF